MSKVTLSRKAKGVCALVVGFVFILAAGFLLEGAYRVANGKEVEGRVLEVSSTSVRVRYPGITKPGEKTFDVGSEHASTLRKGKRLAVVVVSDEEAYLLGGGPPVFPLVLLFIAGAVTIGGGAIAILRPS